MITGASVALVLGQSVVGIIILCRPEVYLPSNHLMTWKLTQPQRLDSLCPVDGCGRLSGCQYTDILPQLLLPDSAWSHQSQLVRFPHQCHCHHHSNPRRVTAKGSSQVRFPRFYQRFRLGIEHDMFLYRASGCELGIFMFRCMYSYG